MSTLTITFDRQDLIKNPIKISKKSFHILKALRKEDALYGGQIINKTKLESGTLYPLLLKLEKLGLLKKECEEGDRKELKRPLRNYYSLTTEGHEALSEYKKKMEELISSLNSMTREIEQQINEL